MKKKLDPKVEVFSPLFVPFSDRVSRINPEGEYEVQRTHYVSTEKTVIAFGRVLRKNNEDEDTAVLSIRRAVSSLPTPVGAVEYKAPDEVFTLVSKAVTRALQVGKPTNETRRLVDEVVELKGLLDILLRKEIDATRKALAVKMAALNHKKK